MKDHKNKYRFPSPIDEILGFMMWFFFVVSALFLAMALDII